MLSVYVPGPRGLELIDQTNGPNVPQEALWIDLLEPTPEEEKFVEKLLDIDVPTRDEMREIEASNRLYEDKGAFYMTATIGTKLDTELPESTQVTFILSGPRLITNRYSDPLPFRRFITYAQGHPNVCTSPSMLLAGLLESIINRIADVLERVVAELDKNSGLVFSTDRTRRSERRDFRSILERIGQTGEVISKTRESLVSLGRLLAFIQQTPNGQISPDARVRFRTLSRDALAMGDYASFLGDKVAFVLEATLGMVTIDQNNILKIFSVVTVFLLPPSVISGFYGMNFEILPLAHEPWGQWVALGGMVASAILPYAYFKRKGWL